MNHTIGCVLTLLHVAVGVGAQPAVSAGLHRDTLRQDTLREVVVSAEARRRQATARAAGVEHVDLGMLSHVPALLGERDVVKSLQLLPGVQAEGDGLGGYQVRGGTSAQNLLLLDGAPVYQASHVMGLFSAFNDDALGSATLYKGLMPAALGGGSSSLLELTTRPGDGERHHFGYTVGLLSAKAVAHGPLDSDGTSTYRVAARRSYLDLFMKASDRYSSDALSFYDVNARVDLRLSERDRLGVALFRGYDMIDVEDLLNMSWANTTLSLSWLHSAADGHTMRTQLVASDFLNDTGVEVYHLHYGMKGYIRPLTLRHQHRWDAATWCQTDAGVEQTLLSLQSADWTILSLHERERRTAWQQALWLAATADMAGRRLQLQGGLRLDAFTALGGAPYYQLDDDGNILATQRPSRLHAVRTHTTLQPRLQLRWHVSPRHTLRLGYSRTSQPIQAIRNSSMALPFDRYTVASNIVQPQLADQVAAGWAAQTADGSWDVSVEGYWKHIDHVYDYRDGKTFQSAIEIERLLLGGEGRAYGLELCAHKNTGRLTGWAAYTLAWAQNRIDGVNDGQWYTATTDRRHDLTLVASWQLGTAWQAAATWRLTSGQAMTPPYAKYEIDGETYYYYARRNEGRAPVSHRLDLSLSHTRQLRHCRRTWTFGLYNAYCHYNPFMVRFDDDPDSPTGTRAVVTTLLGIIPSVSVTVSR